MNDDLTRRQFLSAGAAAGVAALPGSDMRAGVAAFAEMPPARFYAILSLDASDSTPVFPSAGLLRKVRGSNPPLLWLFCPCC